MSDDNPIKITDKRMFTPDGELRDGYRHLDETGSSQQPAVQDPPPVAASEGTETSAAEPPAAQPTGSDRREPAREVPPGAQALGSPTFVDLVAFLAQPIPIYLGEAKLPNGESAENMPMARLHIDFLDLLKSKTAAALTAEETAFLDDLLYQLRLLYVQKQD